MTDLRIVRALARLAVILLCTLALGSTAFADDIPRLQGSITDTTRDQVLANGRSQIQPALDDLLRADDIQLFVLFVDTTGSRTVTDFADESARVNSLGGNDALLVVAMTDRTDAIWRSDAYLDRLTDRELLAVLSQRVEPKLREGDFAGAVIASAQGIREASAAETPSSPSTPSPARDAGPLVWVLLLVGGGVLVWTVFSSKRRERAEAAARQQRDAQRAQEANALLIRADESLRDAKEEMQYAEAQFSAADVAPYRDAVAGAATELKAAFTIRQQLDDAIPEDADTRRRFIEEIVTRATKALSLLEEQRRRVEEMRDMERRAPELLAELHEQISTANGRLPDAEQTLAGLARYAERSWSSVKANVEDARALLGRATSAAAEGDAALDKDDRGAAAKAIRAGQQELAEAGRLIDAIAAAAAAIKEAEGSASGHLAAARADVEKVDAALASTGTAEQHRRLAEARASLGGAENELSAARPDFVEAVRLAAAADAGADAILAEVRQAEERHAQQARIVTTQLQVARATYDRTSDYIAPRRRAIGSTARTRLAEAERHIAQAQELVEADDLPAALKEAQLAQRLADEARSQAEDDLRENEGPWTGLGRVAPVIIGMPFPFPIGGGHGGGWHPGGGGGSVGGGFGRPGGGSVGGKW